MKQKKIVLEELQSMGFEPVRLSELCYAFKHEGVDYVYMPDSNDEHFLRVGIPRLIDVTEDNRADVLEAMQKTEGMIKYAKICIMFESAFAVYEHRISFSEDLSELLEHIIDVLDTAAYMFCKVISSEDRVDPYEDADGISDDELEERLQELLDGIEDED